MRTRSCAWLMNPTAFLKSMYVKYRFSVVNFASSRVAMMVWIYVVILNYGRNFFWPKWSNLCYFP